MNLLKRIFLMSSVSAQVEKETGTEMSEIDIIEHLLNGI